METKQKEVNKSFLNDGFRRAAPYGPCQVSFMTGF